MVWVRQLGNCYNLSRAQRDTACRGGHSTTPFRFTRQLIPTVNLLHKNTPKKYDYVCAARRFTVTPCSAYMKLYTNAFYNAWRKKRLRFSKLESGEPILFILISLFLSLHKYDNYRFLKYSCLDCKFLMTSWRFTLDKCRS